MWNFHVTFKWNSHAVNLPEYGINVGVVNDFSANRVALSPCNKGIKQHRHIEIKLQAGDHL